MNYGLEDIEVQELLVAKKPTPRPSRSRTPVGELKKTVICSRCSCLLYTSDAADD